MKQIGPLLKKFFEDNHYQQSYIADKAGFSSSHLSQILQREDISCWQLERICNACGADPAQFFDVAIEKRETSSSQPSKALRTRISELELLLREKQEMIDLQREMLNLYRDKNGTR